MKKGTYSWNTLRTGTLSEDGTAYWNGAGWVSAVRADGSRWNGRTWEAQPTAVTVTTGILNIALSQVGVVGWLAIALMAVNTYAVLSMPANTGHLTVPFGTLLLVGRRLWKGRVLGALVIGAGWLSCVGVILLFKPPIG